MRKLKLESLQVESFETTSRGPQPRGTVQAHADAAPNSVGCPAGTGVSDCIICQPWSNDIRCQPQTYDVRTCGDTNYLDCTYGCTRLYNTCGGNYCWIDDNTRGCEVK
jgi:transcription elongation factor